MFMTECTERRLEPNKACAQGRTNRKLEYLILRITNLAERVDVLACDLVRTRKVKRVCDPSNDVEAHTHVGRVFNCRVPQARTPQSSHIFGTNSFRRPREFL